MSLPKPLETFLCKLAEKFGYIVTPKNKPYLPWGTAFSTVDIAIVDRHANKILLGRKGTRWCIIGGFTDPTSMSDEEDACRELKEETGLVAQPHELKYIGNFAIPDGRYVGTIHAIRTHFYLFDVNHKVVTPKGSDDIEEVCWFSLKDRFILVDDPNLTDRYIQDSHKILIRALRTFMGA